MRDMGYNVVGSREVVRKRVEESSEMNYTISPKVQLLMLHIRLMGRYQWN